MRNINKPYNKLTIFLSRVGRLWQDYYYVVALCIEKKNWGGMWRGIFYLEIISVVKNA